MIAPRFVPDEGHKHAHIVVIGEAPGRWENLKGKPFVGPSWNQRLHPWLSEVGLSRSDLYITNTYPYQPPGNQLNLIPKADREPWLDDLHNRIADLKEPVVLVPMGEYALHALTGKWKISNHRGSIYEYTDRRGRPIKVIPTLHPAATFRTLSWEARCRADWKRIASDARFPDLRLPVREHYIRPTLDDLRWFLEDARKADVIGLDIETPRVFEDKLVTLKSGKQVMKQVYGAARIACIGLALSPDFSITIPTLQSYWGARTLPVVWALIREILALPVPKIGQSGMPFDLWWLRQPEYACPVENYVYDTRWLHHCLNPLDEHSLHYMASIDTREPYWKAEGKVEGDLERMPRDLDQFWRYCGKDVATTVELANKYEARVVKAGRWDFYCDWYLAMFEPLLRMSLHGTRLDDKARRWHVARMTANVITAQERLRVLNDGEPLFSMAKTSKGDISNAKLTEFLYGKLKLPKAYKTRKTKGGGEKVKTTTADEVTVRRLMIEHPAKLGEAGGLILDIRHDSKQVASFNKQVADADGRVRSSYGMTTTLRLTSSKNPARTGRNMQNIDREKAVRRMFLPDPGCIFLEVDESQAESRVVYVRTEDPELIEIAYSKPWEFDDHKRTASIVFQVPVDQVDKEQRQYGKKTRHATLTPDHDVLTRDGWCSIDKVLDDEPIATWAPSGSGGLIEFERPLRWTRVPYDGPVISVQGRSFNQVMTPNHRVPYYNNDTWGERTGATIPRYARTPITGVQPLGTVDVSPAYARLVAAMWADGSLPKRYTRRSRFGLTKDRKKRRLRQLLKDAWLSFEYTEREYPSRPGHAIFTIKRRLRKELDWDMLHWSVAAREAFLDELPHWDGSTQGGVYRIFNTDAKGLEIIQAIAHTTGRSGHCIQHGKPRKGRKTCWLMNLSESPFAAFEQMLTTTLQYVGMIHCPTVTSGWFLVRRGGIVSVTGNSSYGMQGRQMADDLLKEAGIVRTPQECDAWIERLHARDPGIRRWHRDVRRAALRDQRLVNAFGGTIDIRGQRLTDDLYRMLYAWEPQSTVAMIMNQWGLRPLDEALQAGRWPGARINLQTHDSITASVPPTEAAWEILQFLYTSLERPLHYGPKGTPLTIPVETKLGRDLSMSYEFKKPPTRDEFIAAVEALAKEVI